MRLTSYSDYSVRVLIYLSIHNEKLNNIKDIAHVYGISKNHLMKIIYNLGKLGYIETIRGRNGGIRLAKEPNDINLGELLRHTEEDFHIVECFSKEHNHCAISPVCNLKGVFFQAKQAFLQVLDAYTLEDVVKNRIVLKEYLQNHAEEKNIPHIVETYYEKG